MNASAPALTREVEIQSKIGKVRAFSRAARIVCSAVFGFGLVGIVGVTLLGLAGAVFHGPDKAMALTSVQKMWLLPISCVVAGVFLATVYQLYRLFGNLAAGAIYTPENVRRLRHVGLLWLLLAVIGVLFPALAFVLSISSVSVPKSTLAFSISESLSSFASAGLILLASWIMDVGLYEKDHADALQRDADLVI